MQNYQYPNQPPYQPMQPITNQYPQPMPQNYTGMPYQPVQSPVVVGASAPLLNTNLTQNVSLKASECFEELNASSEANLTKYFEGLLFKDLKYEVTIRYKTGVENRYIFVGKKTSSSIFDKNSFKIRVKYIPIDANVPEIMKEKKFDDCFFEVSTINNLIRGLSTPKVQSLFLEKNIAFGNIQQPNACCCSDPDFQLKNNFNFTKYRIVTNGCQCAYCCCNGCCCLNFPVTFSILDSTRTQILGNIFKSGVSGGSKELLTYRIVFPLDATPEEKILIISAAMAIDNFSYREVGK